MLFDVVIVCSCSGVVWMVIVQTVSGFRVVRWCNSVLMQWCGVDNDDCTGSK